MRILVVDDNGKLLVGIKRELEEAGHEVEIFDYGMELIQRLKNNPDCDAVVTDKNMPGMDGFEVIEAIRKEKRFAELPIIMHSSEPGLRRLVENAGALYAEKEFPYENLLAVLKTVEKKV